MNCLIFQCLDRYLQDPRVMKTLEVALGITLTKAEEPPHSGMSVK